MKKVKKRRRIGALVILLALLTLFAKSATAAETEKIPVPSRPIMAAYSPSPGVVKTNEQTHIQKEASSPLLGNIFALGLGLIALVPILTYWKKKTDKSKRL